VGLERQIDKAINNAKYMAEQIKKRDGYELVSEPEYTNCSFWYYPLSMRGPTPPDPHKLTKVGWGTLSQLNDWSCWPHGTSLTIVIDVYLQFYTYAHTYTLYMTSYNSYIALLLLLL